MEWEAWITICVTVFVFVALARELAPPDMLFFAATSLFALLGIISPTEAFAGFSNSGVITVAVLFVIAAGLRETGVLDSIGSRLLHGARSEAAVIRRLAGIVIPMSAFLNNTPIVAMFMPIVIEWCRRHRVSPSRLLLPLSYLTILGGTCTLIGTSTNLVTHGLLIRSGMPGLTLFELSWVGVPYAFIGTLYILFARRKLLPERKDLLEQLGESRREYLVEMLVQPGCRLIGQTVEAAGLRHLPGLFLFEIDRNGTLIGPVDPQETLLAGDRLNFTGVVSSIVDLEKIPGLLPAADPAYEISPRQQRSRRLCEAVVSETSPLIGQTIRESDFRATYGGAVLAVHRSGARIEGKVGSIALRPGDTLLLQVRPSFVSLHRHDPAFYLISDVPEWRPPRSDRMWIAVLLFVILLVLMTTELIPTVIAASLIAVAMVALGCLSRGDARRSVDWQVLVTIASSFGMGAALQNSGAATAIATAFVNLAQGWGPVAAVAVIYLLASLVTELITNNAVVVLMFPICVEAARLLDVSPRPLLIALTVAASASFMTPIGYQTNMMVYGPGGYRLSDYLKFGTPLNLLLWPVAVVLIPLFWPFQ